MNESSKNSHAVICGLVPYFLEKEYIWFEKHLDEILEARKTQSFFQDNVLYLAENQVVGLSEILRRLDEMGYEKVYRPENPGDFSQKGGILEIFPINSGKIVRLDFLGNRIERIEFLGKTLEDEKAAKDFLRKKLRSQKMFSDLKSLKVGDCLVHLDHGIGRFLGIVGQKENEKYYLLEYAKGDKLYVPLGLERKLSRYVGFSEPQISRLASPLWQKTKRKIKEDAEKLAKELLEIYAKREVSFRPPYLPDDEIDRQVASSFKYRETPDQSDAIEDIRKDLERTKPMDRLLCGDVGFGKTEVALRAVVKVVKSGFQASLLAPTTILANQHFQTFKERLKKIPIKPALLSRLQSKKEQKEILDGLEKGSIDVLIGTHRLLSKDVKYRNLGILVIDDEQKFGVKQKEKLKKMRSRLDILSLSATPIPRTLYLSLTSLRDVSLIQTPPEGRLPVKNYIIPFSAEIIRKAIEKEIKRNGQIYYLHNKVETINSVAAFLEKLVPSAKFGIVHGRLKEKELIKTMTDFQNKKTDVLVATTIIESGLDLPDVNTLLVAETTHLGLAQAYQIRGRVGRSGKQAFAYFFFGCRLSEKAGLRLKALKEAEELGSGYKIALKDLEIRGAGNILGREQSGKINQVGLNLYCLMLSEAVEKLKHIESNNH